MATAEFGYAIVNADGVICSLHDEHTTEGWGETRELVKLTQTHREGDIIDWGADGVETVETDADDPNDVRGDHMLDQRKDDEIMGRGGR